MCGSEPLPWWALGLYQGPLRNLLLRQRRNPSDRAIPCLARALARTLPAQLRELSIVAIPSWKQRANPLPQLICQGLGLPRLAPLERSRATLGQHHLNRRLRALNQEGAFRVIPSGLSPSRRSRQGLLLVDDILTSGASSDQQLEEVASEDFLQRSFVHVVGHQGSQVRGDVCSLRPNSPGAEP
ncbi:ComF family protein [Synechococcus sp. CS-205]|uniref:ComF family protein n=1 Tax=Synechococcus sp. CS-205 TaxID=2847984 RepID=UPI00223BA581|nr:ComF family protein [Synechococcus sp. CS-205]MCT0247876.1 ComF family protein [Synechococcus sp. CS-205]